MVRADGWNSDLLPLMRRSQILGFPADFEKTNLVVDFPLSASGERRGFPVQPGGRSAGTAELARQRRRRVIE